MTEIEEKINRIKKNCARRGIELAIMNEHLNNQSEKIDQIFKKVDSLDRKLEEGFVSKIEFSPYKDKINRIYGFVWAILFSSLLIVIYWILNSTGLPHP